jgi:tripartite-type tricarboxylate transporter receptor subunit TctC
MDKRMTGMPRSIAAAMSRLLPRLGRLAVVAAGLALMAVNSAVAADSYPSRPIKMISPFSAGSPPDAFGRLIAQQMSATLGHSVVVENRPGAGTTLGTKAGAMADPDGYTLVQANAALSYAPVLYPNSGYDPVKSFVPVAMLATWTHVLVAHPDVPANSMQELVAYAKANPGKLNIGFPLGSPPNILAEMFKTEIGADINSVPYRQAPLLVSDVVAGRVQLYFSAGEPIFSMIRNGKLKAYAFTAAMRDPGFPNVPTMAEAGLPKMTVDPSDWTGILAPAGTPAPVIAKLNAAINDALDSSETRAALAKLGWRVSRTTPERFSAFVSAAVGKWSSIVTAAGLKGD